MTSNPLFPARALTAEVAHELSNDLSCLTILPDLILDKLPSDNPWRNDLLEMKQAAQRIDELAHHLSYLSLEESLQTTLGLNGPVRVATESFQNRATPIGASVVTVSLEDMLPPVRGVTEWISVITRNLILNALDAQPAEGNVSVTTKSVQLLADRSGFETVPAGDYVVLSVKDTGKELSSLDQTHLFEPYHAFNVMGRRSMTGLGLAVVHRLAKKQGAFVTTRTTPQGSAVEIYFPAQSMEIPSDQGKSLSTGSNRVMIVDDRQEQRALFSRILEGAGYQTASLGCGEDALRHVSSVGADLVILDISLRRDRDGLDLYSRILERIPTIKVVLVSGFPRETYTGTLTSLRDRPFLKKPFSADDLLKTVRDVLPLSSEKNS